MYLTMEESTGKNYYAWLQLGSLAASNIRKKKHYLYSSIVEAQYHGHSFLLKLVFVSNRENKNKHSVLATTQTKLRPEEIIQLYGRRWQIKTYFKTSKQYLTLDKSQAQSYDGQCGYIAVTAITYDLLAWQERQNTDDKTIGDLFYLMNESLPDIRFVDALVYLISELKELKQNSFEKIDEVINDFINQLPRFIQIALKQII